MEILSQDKSARESLQFQLVDSQLIYSVSTVNQLLLKRAVDNGG